MALAALVDAPAMVALLGREHFELALNSQLFLQGANAQSQRTST